MDKNGKGEKLQFFSSPEETLFYKWPTYVVVLA